MAECEYKYVVTESEESGEQLFIFPKTINHDEFADVLSYIRTGGLNWRREYRKPISAGFTDLQRCFGRSETLRIDSRPDEDTALLKRGGFK